MRVNLPFRYTLSYIRYVSEPLKWQYFRAVGLQWRRLPENFAILPMAFMAGLQVD